jgi:threonyl-tRNA synthetase
MRLFPETKLDVGPPTDSGCSYDFDLGHRFIQEDLAVIEGEMVKIIGENQEFIRREISRDEAREIFSGLNQNYKVGRLDDIPPGEKITTYTNSEFTDLCRGGHVRNSSQVKAVKLLSIAGAY